MLDTYFLDALALGPPIGEKFFVGGIPIFSVYISEGLKNIYSKGRHSLLLLSSQVLLNSFQLFEKKVTQLGSHLGRVASRDGQHPLDLRMRLQPRISISLHISNSTESLTSVTPSNPSNNHVKPHQTSLPIRITHFPPCSPSPALLAMPSPRAAQCPIHSTQ